jgi:hypothetical protein
VFDTKTPLDADALRGYRRIEAEAPPEIRASVRQARQGAVAFWKGGTQFKDDPQSLTDYLAAKRRVDHYLEHECGIDLESRTGGGT